MLLNRFPGGGVSIEAATATPSKVLAPYTFFAGENEDIQTGAIQSKGAATITPGTTNQTIAAGQYLYGDQTILGDPDLIPANIRTGKNIFGVNGTGPGLPDTILAGDTVLSFFIGRVQVEGSYANVRGFQIKRTGTYRFVYDFYCSTSQQSAWSRLTVNGTVVAGSEASNAGSPNIVTIDVPLWAGDIVYLQLRNSNSSNRTYNQYFLVTILASGMQAELNLAATKI